jgi:hypothetical protein
MKKINKKLVKILIILALILMLTCCCNAAFASSYKVANDLVATDVPFADSIVSVVQFGCYTAAVIWILIVGVKYMTSAPDGKAEMKKQAFAALIGGLILFGVGSIIQWVHTMTQHF